MWSVTLSDGREVNCGRNYSGWSFPTNQSVAEEYRGKSFTARYGRTMLDTQTILIIEVDGMDKRVIEASKSSQWSDIERKLAEAVYKIVPRGM